MNIIEILLPISVLLAGGFAFAFVMAVRSGQFDDVDTPPQRILFDAPKAHSTQNIANEKNLSRGQTSEQTTGETT